MKANKYYYPAIFHVAEEGGFWISFPDFEGILSQGDSFEEAIEMAKSALGLELCDLELEGKEYPKSSIVSQVKHDKKDVVVMIELDLLEYKRTHNSFAVKKTLSIPSWLNEEAIAAGLNFSAILQQGLKKELGY